MTSSKPNYLPKAPSLNTITLGVRASTYELGGWPRFSPQHMVWYSKTFTTTSKLGILFYLLLLHTSAFWGSKNITYSSQNTSYTFTALCLCSFCLLCLDSCSTLANYYVLQMSSDPTCFVKSAWISSFLYPYHFYQIPTASIHIAVLPEFKCVNLSKLFNFLVLQ